MAKSLKANLYKVEYKRSPSTCSTAVDYILASNDMEAIEILKAYNTGHYSTLKPQPTLVSTEVIA